MEDTLWANLTSEAGTRLPFSSSFSLPVTFWLAKYESVVVGGELALNGQKGFGHVLGEFVWLAVNLVRRRNSFRSIE